MNIILYLANEFDKIIKIDLPYLLKLDSKVSVLGFYSENKFSFMVNGMKLNFIDINELQKENFDFIIIIGIKYDFITIKTRLVYFGIDPNKILSDAIIRIPKFTLKKYKKLVKSRVSIFSINCSGGYIYNLMNMQFLSPFINLHFSERDFLYLLYNPKIIMSPISYLKNDQDKNSKLIYPVGLIDKIQINFNHYPNFEIAQQKFYERRMRINWYNIVVISYTDDIKYLEQFDELPYAKKVCFTSFDSDIDSGFYISQFFKSKYLELWDAVNHFGA